MAILAYTTGISPGELMDTDPEIFDAMVEHHHAVVKAMNKGKR